MIERLSPRRLLAPLATLTIGLGAAACARGSGNTYTELIGVLTCDRVEQVGPIPAGYTFDSSSPLALGGDHRPVVNAVNALINENEGPKGTNAGETVFVVAGCSLKFVEFPPDAIESQVPGASVYFDQPVSVTLQKNGPTVLSGVAAFIDGLKGQQFSDRHGSGL